MLKPREGYVIANAVEKSNIILSEGIANKIIKAVAVPKGSDIKVGDELIVDASIKIMGIKEDDKDYLIIPTEGICATK